MDEKFLINLLRMIAASTSFQNGLCVAREMFGKSYFALGMAEKAVVDQAVLAHLGGIYTAITPEYLADPQVRQPMGFPIHTAAPTPGSSTTP